MSWKVEVIADNSGKWCGNGLCFRTLEGAEAYARDLESRWTLVRQWRAVRSDDPPSQSATVDRWDGPIVMHPTQCSEENS